MPQFVKTFKRAKEEKKKRSSEKQKRHLASPERFSRLVFRSPWPQFEASQGGGFATCRQHGAEQSLVHAGHVLRGRPAHTLCFSLSSLTCLPLCPGHPSPRPIAFSLFMCQQHYHGEPSLLLPSPPVAPHTLRWMFCPPFAFCSALVSQGHM